MKQFKLGVYIKPNGNLVTVEIDDNKETRNSKYIVVDGTKANYGIYMMFKKSERPFSLIGSSSLDLGWGPSAFMNTCEYLGEL